MYIIVTNSNTQGGDSVTFCTVKTECANIQVAS